MGGGGVMAVVKYEMVLTLEVDTHYYDPPEKWDWAKRLGPAENYEIVSMPPVPSALQLARRLGRAREIILKLSKLGDDLPEGSCLEDWNGQDVAELVTEALDWLDETLKRNWEV